MRAGLGVGILDVAELVDELGGVGILPAEDTPVGHSVAKRVGSSLRALETIPRKRS